MIFANGKQNDTFTVKLSGIPVEVNCLYQKTRKFFSEYITDEPPLYHIYVTKSDIKKERKLSLRQQKKEGHFPIWYKGSYLETLATCRKIMDKLLEKNILLFHGAVMAVHGKAYIFTAKSGTGKTTHCRLWLKNIPDCHILNGDKPLLLFKEGQIFTCSSPWMGKENYGRNEILPLEGICFLERDMTNHIEEISLKECFERFLAQCYIPKGNRSIARVVSMTRQIKEVKLYSFGCNMEDEAAFVSYGKMVEGK